MELTCVHPKVLAVMYSSLVIFSLAIGFALSMVLRSNLMAPVY